MDNSRIIVKIRFKKFSALYYFIKAFETWQKEFREGIEYGADSNDDDDELDTISEFSDFTDDLHDDIDHVVN